MGIFDGYDIFVFLFTLFLTLLIGIFASKSENTSSDFFLGGKTLRWWGIAGSIFGTNVSATHIVGMLGVGYSIGFAQSHYEFGAIPALLLLAYIFLPVYHRLGVTTLSEYLEIRFDERSRLLYSLVLILLIILQMTASFYIGSRSMFLLFKGTSLETGYVSGIFILAFVTTTYTIFGGLKAVVWTDVIQSVIILIGSFVICYLTFTQPEVGGWSGLLLKEGLIESESKMRLFLPSDHPDLPLSGAFSGLIMLHFFYWGTNQYLVQRALGAISEKEARIGIISASFFKLLIPFLSITTGVAAYHFFKGRGLENVIVPDSALPELLKLIVPSGFGLSGIIAAAILGAILSSLDSMMNSGATLFTLDIYKKYMNKNASDQKLVRVSQITMIVIVILSIWGAIRFFGMDYQGSFVLRISALSSYLIPGIVVVFMAGMLSRKASPTGAFVAILIAPFLGLGIEYVYNNYLYEMEIMNSIFGLKLNFMYRVFFSLGVSFVLLYTISRFSKRFPQKEELNWMDIVGQSKTDIYFLVTKVFIFILFQALFVYLTLQNLQQKHWFSLIAFIFTMSLFLYNLVRHLGGISQIQMKQVFREDRFYAGLLASTTAAILLMFL
jgi:solute:Na+ symporter, SSS family